MSAWPGSPILSIIFPSNIANSIDTIFAAQESSFYKGRDQVSSIGSVGPPHRTDPMPGQQTQNSGD